MSLSITPTELKAKDNGVTFQNEEVVLNIFWSERLGKFITEFNCKFMATSKTLPPALNKFNKLADKYSLSN